MNIKHKQLNDDKIIIIEKKISVHNLNHLNTLKSENYYNETVKFCRDKVLNTQIIYDAKWKSDAQGAKQARKDRPDQILITPRICYSLNICF